MANFYKSNDVDIDFSEEEKLLLSAAYGIDGSRTRSAGMVSMVPQLLSPLAPFLCSRE